MNFWRDEAYQASFEHLDARGSPSYEVRAYIVARNVMIIGAWLGSRMDNAEV